MQLENRSTKTTNNDFVANDYLHGMVASIDDGNVVRDDLVVYNYRDMDNAFVETINLVGIAIGSSVDDA